MLTVLKLVQSANFREINVPIFMPIFDANFGGDKCANGPHTNFSLQSSILQNINFLETCLRGKLFNDLLNFFETL